MTSTRFSTALVLAFVLSGCASSSSLPSKGDAAFVPESTASGSMVPLAARACPVPGKKYASKRMYLILPKLRVTLSGTGLNSKTEIYLPYKMGQRIPTPPKFTGVLVGCGMSNTPLGVLTFKQLSYSGYGCDKQNICTAYFDYYWSVTSPIPKKTFKYDEVLIKPVKPTAGFGELPFGLLQVNNH